MASACKQLGVRQHLAERSGIGDGGPQLVERVEPAREGRQEIVGDVVVSQEARIGVAEKRPDLLARIVVEVPGIGRVPNVLGESGAEQQRQSRNQQRDFGEKPGACRCLLR